MVEGGGQALGRVGGGRWARGGVDGKGPDSTQQPSSKPAQVAKKKIEYKKHLKSQVQQIICQKFADAFVLKIDYVKATV